MVHSSPGGAPRVHRDRLPAVLEAMSREDAASYLRQAFVSPEDLNRLVVDRSDAARFVNHSSRPSVSEDGRATRDIEAGEELTIDYACHGDPPWYRKLCAHYGLLTEAQIADKY